MPDKNPTVSPSELKNEAAPRTASEIQDTREQAQALLILAGHLHPDESLTSTPDSEIEVPVIPVESLSPLPDKKE